LRVEKFSISQVRQLYPPSPSFSQYYRHACLFGQSQKLFLPIFSQERSVRLAFYQKRSPISHTDQVDRFRLRCPDDNESFSSKNISDPVLQPSASLVVRQVPPGVEYSVS